MKGFARVIVVFLTLVALAVGFVGGTVVLDVFQPSNKQCQYRRQLRGQVGRHSVSAWRSACKTMD